MAIEDLLKVLEPPREPLEAGPREKWKRIQSDLGTKLPTDFRDFGLHYGSGRIHTPNIDIRVLNPFSNAFMQQQEETTGAWRAYREAEGDSYVPYGVFPESPGLLSWGDDVNGNGLFWLTVGDPEYWPIVVCAHESVRSAFWRIDMTFTQFLSLVLQRRIPTPIWPSVFFSNRDEIIFERTESNAYSPEKLQSVYSLYIENENRTGYWIEHPTWRHDGMTARVKSIGGKSEGPLVGSPPEFGGAAVIAQLFENDKLVSEDEEIIDPELEMYHLIPTPKWWQGSPS